MPNIATTIATLVANFETHPETSFSAQYLFGYINALSDAKVLTLSDAANLLDRVTLALLRVSRNAKK